MRVLGTAGHVDHGKSTLVRALTGIDPDRLIEEKRREMTIDLGFAWFSAPSGEMVGLVDVPGHRDFIENMLAGIGGIDAVLFVIAADEGIMPQTREHLAILDLLMIPRLIVALTKTDLVQDDEWLELVVLDIQDAISNTHFETAPIIPVSAFTGAGLTQLVEVIATTLAELQSHTSTGLPYLPVDRVFTLSGFGTVVTGTLLDGNLKVGDIVEILPQSLQARIRGLQSHNQSVEIAFPNNRTAVNLVGVEKSDIKRGDVLTLPITLRPTQLVDVELIHLREAPRPLKHNAEVKIFIGTAEATARVRLLFADSLPPNTQGWGQLQLDSPLPIKTGQRFIIRTPSPPATIGGGRILDNHPPYKWKREKPEVYARFERLALGTPLALLSEMLIQANYPLYYDEIIRHLPELGSIMLDESILREGGWFLHRQVLQSYAERLDRMLATFHAENPLQNGIHQNTLRRRFNLSVESWQVLLKILEKQGIVGVYRSIYVHLPDFQVQYSRSQRAAVDRIFKTFAQNPYTPPSVKEVEAEISAPVLDALVRQGDLVKLNAEVLLSVVVYRRWLQHVYENIQDGEGIKLADFRDAFQTSRKYALAFLDHLESLGLTRRIEEMHVIGNKDWSSILTPDD